MKFLTSVTIVLAIPTIVSSLYGMNVHLPGQVPLGFRRSRPGHDKLAGGATWALAKRRMF